MTTLFIRNNTQSSEIEKLKSAKFSEVANELLKNGHITNLEYYKCRNFLKIAKIADALVKENRDKDTKWSLKNEFDFDWFIRFFDAASNISNEEMQHLWAKVLAGEVSSPGSFSLRTIETLNKMTQREALMFLEISNLAIQTIDGMWFVIADGPSSFNLDEINDLVIPNQKVRLLQECGLLNPIKDDLIIWYSINPIKSPLSINGNFALINSTTLLAFNAPKELNTKVQSKIKKEKSTFFPYYPLTEAGMQLLKIILTDCEYNYLLQLGFAISAHQKTESKRRVTAHPLLKIDDSNIYFDSSIDLIKRM